MAIPATNKQCPFPTLLQRECADGAAKRIFFHAPIYTTLVLRFFSSPDLAKLAVTNRAFCGASITAAEHEIRTKKTISFQELDQFAKHKIHCGNISNFERVSPFLIHLTELDLSNLNFADESIWRLHTLSEERLQKITSLNFTSAQNLTLGKLKSLLFRMHDHQRQVYPLSSLAAFPHLTSLNFIHSDFKLNPVELFLECTLSRNGRAIWTAPDGGRYEGRLTEVVTSGCRKDSSVDGKECEGTRVNGEYDGQEIMTEPTVGD